MNISTLAKILGVSISDLRDVGVKNSLYGFYGRNTRIPYNSAVEITKILRPEKLNKLKNDDKIYLPQFITVSEFAETIGKPVSLVVKTLMLNGVIATLSEQIDYDTANIIAEELGVEVYPENDEFDTVAQNANAGQEQLIKIVEYSDDDSTKTLVQRPPVVTVMGHVDHGKTTLLDTIRRSNVVASEAGAITQHISSYQIEYAENETTKGLNLPKGKGGYKITFIDTPGHEAFTAMRARGSQLADFIILMVSAVEGPKPQTVEVIERAKLGKIPVIVALNKIDLPDSDPERVKADIANYGLVPEEWGGDVPFIPISAKTGENLPKILETILLHAALKDLKGEVSCAGQAVAIETNMDSKLGNLVTALVVKDKLKVGDVIRCGEVVGKIKKLETTEGKSIQEAILGEPIVILGLSGNISVGDAVIVYPSVKAAQNDANLEQVKKSNSKRVITSANTLTSENQINLVLKADVSGSLEALKEVYSKFLKTKSKSISRAKELDQLLKVM
jgi:translation initiation factor IF-2